MTDDQHDRRSEALEQKRETVAEDAGLAKDRDVAEAGQAAESKGTALNSDAG